MTATTHSKSTWQTPSLAPLKTRETEGGASLQKEVGETGTINES